MNKFQKNKHAGLELPAIPSKHYMNISEVAALCDVESFVLRYWEQEFPQLRPIKRRGNRRYYQKKDVILIREIIDLLYIQGFTIEGARLKLAAKAKIKQNNQQQEAQQNNHQPSEKDKPFIQNLFSSLEKIVLELETDF